MYFITASYINVHVDEAMPEPLSVLQCTTCMFCLFFSVNAHLIIFFMSKGGQLKIESTWEAWRLPLEFPERAYAGVMCIYQNITTEQFPFSIVWKSQFGIGTASVACITTKSAHYVMRCCSCCNMQPSCNAHLRVCPTVLINHLIPRAIFLLGFNWWHLKDIPCLFNNISWFGKASHWTCTSFVLKVSLVQLLCNCAIKQSAVLRPLTVSCQFFSVLASRI